MFTTTNKNTPHVNQPAVDVSRGVKQMWYVSVTLITFRFKPTRVSLVGLISGQWLKVKGGQSHYLREENTISQTIK